jgi:hypothetical protein
VGRASRISLVVIPIAIVLGAVSGGTWQWSYGRTTAVAGGLLFFGPRS